MQVVPTLEATNPAIRTWRQTDEGGPTSLPTSVIYMDLPVRVSPCHPAHVYPQLSGIFMALDPLHYTSALTDLRGIVSSVTCNTKHLSGNAWTGLFQWQ